MGTRGLQLRFPSSRSRIPSPSLLRNELCSADCVLAKPSESAPLDSIRQVGAANRTFLILKAGLTTTSANQHSPLSLREWRISNWPIACHPILYVPVRRQPRQQFEQPKTRHLELSAATACYYTNLRRRLRRPPWVSACPKYGRDP